MPRHAAVIGGSVAGLATAIALARRGWTATVVERDPAPDTNDGDDAFVSWDRRNVPQFRHPHAFSALERQELISCVGAGALRDPILGRAQLRRTNLLESPKAVLDDPSVVERARNTQSILAGKVKRPTGPDRDELAAMLAAVAR